MEAEAKRLAQTLNQIFSQRKTYNKRDIKKDYKDRVQEERLGEMFSAEDTEDSISSPPKSMITSEVQAEGGEPSQSSEDHPKNVQQMAAKHK